MHLQTEKGKIYKILVVEDSENKWLEIENSMRSLLLGSGSFTRATTVIEAEKRIELETWDLLILDVSMDISASVTGPKRGGHDPLGGLRLANKMYLLAREVQTIIVTAFDAFPSGGDVRKGGSEILGLEDVQRRAAHLLGRFYRGCVRYGDVGWQRKLEILAREVFSE